MSPKTALACDTCTALTHLRPGAVLAVLAVLAALAALAALVVLAAAGAAAATAVDASSHQLPFMYLAPGK